MGKNCRWLIALFPLFIISCDDDPIEPEPDGPEEFVYYWKATVDGSVISYETGIDDHLLINDISTDEIADGDSINLIPGAAISSPTAYVTGYGQIDFMGNVLESAEYAADKAAALANIFTVGEHSFAVDYFTTTPGINIRRDINYVQWWSLYEEQPETSSFIVTESIASTSYGIPARRVKGTFNCIIISEDGESKIIEDGAFFLQFIAP
ncbi:MAG: hypothetical protein ACI8ZM_002320 [Crocinitomix sp.]|jgi:hypothetical protein